MLFEVGKRIPVEAEVCRCRSEEECEKVCSQPVEPGRIYEVQLTLEGAVSKEEIHRLYDVIKYVKERYPGIGIAYIGITDDGKRIIVQVFDPPPEELPIPKIVWYIVFVIALAVLAYFVLRFTEVVVYTVGAVVRRVPSWVWTAIGVGAAAALAGYGVYKLAEAIRR